MRKLVHSRAAAAILLACAGIPAACRRAGPPTVVLISIDTLRADHLPAYGYAKVATPAIDALRRDGILFTAAYSHVPLTLPSHATLLTGLLPFENGVRDNAGFRLAPGSSTIATVLRGRGFATGAAVSSFVLRRDRGLDAGFDLYDDTVGGPARERAGVETVRALTAWARGAGSRPLFLFAHLYEPHAPYAPPEPYRSAYRSAPYDGEIAAADAAVGELVGFLRGAGLYDRAAIVLLSDHGEGLGQHGEDEHGVFLYREDVRVPLIVKLPGAERRGTTVDAPAGLTDVLPTIAEIAGAAVPAKAHGVSLLALARGASPTRDIYSETLYPRFALGWSDLASLENARFQYVQAPRPELYDLRSDPGETRNLVPARPPELRRLAVELAGMSRPFQAPSAVSAEEVRTLASLGYLSGAGGGKPGALPDPKDHVAALRSFRALFDRHAAGDFAGTIAAAREVLRDSPTSFSAREMLSDSLVRTGRAAEGCDVLTAAVREAGPDVSREQLAQAYDNLSVLLARLGRTEERDRLVADAARRGIAGPEMKTDLARSRIAEGKPAEAIAILADLPDPGARALVALGIAEAETGRAAEAESAFQRALAKEPRDAEAAFNLGTLLLGAGRTEDAVAWLGRACEWAPDDAAAWSSLGLARARQGNEPAAGEAWKRALQIDGRQPDALFNLALWEGRRGAAPESAALLRRFLALPPPPRYAAQAEQARRILAAGGAR